MKIQYYMPLLALAFYCGMTGVYLKQSLSSGNPHSKWHSELNALLSCYSMLYFLFPYSPYKYVEKCQKVHSCLQHYSGVVCFQLLVCLVSSALMLLISSLIPMAVKELREKRKCAQSLALRICNGYFLVAALSYSVGGLNNQEVLFMTFTFSSISET